MPETAYVTACKMRHRPAGHRIRAEAGGSLDDHQDITTGEITMEHKTFDRRAFLKAAAGPGLAAATGTAGAQTFEFKPNQRYPDPSVQILDPSFGKYRIYSSSVEQLASGMRWA